MKMVDAGLESLPEECLSQVISFTSPGDACRSSLVSATVRRAADSDLVWMKFLPSDYREIISRSVSPVEFLSYKDLFLRVCSTPLLIDGGKKTFSVDKSTNKKCYMLSARELSIAWATNSLFWCWKPLLHSRFPESVELIMVCWLEIRGKINSRMLSPYTTYGAYLVVRIENRAFGLDVLPSQVSVEVGDCKTQGTIYLKHHQCIRKTWSALHQREEHVICERDDGWLEIELGEFYNDGSGKEVNMLFKENKGEHLKGGLVVEGIELRPKQHKLSGVTK